jgi:hypothetical protein
MSVDTESEQSRKALFCKAFHESDGGEGGIRTHGTVARTPVFKTGALNRSATSPAGASSHESANRRNCENAAFLSASA